MAESNKTKAGLISRNQRGRQGPAGNNNSADKDFSTDYETNSEVEVVSANQGLLATNAKEIDSPYSMEKGSPFQKSSKIKRSPATTPGAGTSHNVGRVLDAHLARDEVEGGIIDVLSECSPRRSYILKMRSDEEEQIAKGKDIIRKMKAATSRQRNISMDVKNGLAKLEEVLDVIEYCRKAWRMAEEQEQNAGSDPNLTPTVTENSRAAKRSVALTDGIVAARVIEKEDLNSVISDPNSWNQQLSRKNRRKAKMDDGPGNDAPESNRATPGQRKRKKIRPSNPRREAVLIKPSGDRTYAGVLKKIRENVDPDEVGVSVHSLRRTQNGDVLIELEQQSQNREEFIKKIGTIVGEEGIVQMLTPRVTVEIRDIDDMTEPEDVKKAIYKEIGNEGGEVEVNMTKSNTRGQRMAFVKIDEKVVTKLLERSRIRIGWVNCRIRLKTEIQRCYRCLGYGHRAVNCKGQDRREDCYRCGKKRHLAKDCKEEPKCVLCAEEELSEISHVPGTRKCEVFIKALAKVSSRSIR